ncbi:hypothetical protein EC988_005500 [Linderina pennispora]|nr:hypothetical protein EC988_005500 [Linderina pennispora]
MYEGLNPSASQSISDNAQDGGSDQQQAEAAAKRRSVNSSKRAAQNRAAQRAFRLRREKYVTSLEDKARRYDKLEAAYMELQKANFEMQGQIQELRHENARLRSRLASGSPSPSVRPTSFSPSGPLTPNVGSMIPVGPHMPISQESVRPPPPPPPRHAYAYQGRPEVASYQYEYPRAYGAASSMGTAVAGHQSFSPQPHMASTGFASAAPRPTFNRPAAHHPGRHTAAQHLAHHSAHVRHNPSPPSPNEPKHQAKQAVAGPLYASSSAGFTRSGFQHHHSLSQPRSPTCAGDALQFHKTAAGPPAQADVADRKLPLRVDSGTASEYRATSTPPFRPAGMPGPHTPNPSGSSQMLPSMRELTMSIASSLPTSPQNVDPSQQSHFPHSQQDMSRVPPDAGGDAAMDDMDQKRRPW